jgi:hypothetical protein
MIWQDEINALKTPYAIKIMGADKAGFEAQTAIRLHAQRINNAGASDRSADPEITMVIESSN